jgi:hypothetical protein
MGCRNEPLFRCNLFAAIAHFIIFIFLMTQTTLSSPIPTTMSKSIGTPTKANRTQIEIIQNNIAVLSSIFSFLAFITHVLYCYNYEKYKKYIENKQNIFRWIEYSFSASLMIVTIYLVAGVTDLAALIGAFGNTAAMISYGYQFEKATKDSDKWNCYYFGCAFGILPWICILIYFFHNGANSNAPWYVYFIIFGLLGQFMGFGIVPVLQLRYKYTYEECEYIYTSLSLTSKTSLALNMWYATKA